MKKIGLLTAAVVMAVLGTSSANAQSTQTVKGTNYLNAGIGLGTFGLSGTGGLPITGEIHGR